MKRRDAGFTLIELLVVISIVGILLSAIPVARGYMPELQINKATRALAQDLRDARALAVRNGNDVIVAFYVAEGQILIYNDEAYDGLQVYDLVRTHSLAYYGGGVLFAAVTSTGIDGTTITQVVKMGGTSNPIAVTFRANGAAVNPGVLYLAPARDGSPVELGRAVEILSTGKVQSWKFDVTGSPGPWKKWL
jgi:prepilin-type N-terminal cleavage/methylation domain-containing protein